LTFNECKSTIYIPKINFCQLKNTRGLIGERGERGERGRRWWGGKEKSVKVL
jgi:hypothetical protein